MMPLHTQFRFTSVAFAIALCAIGRVILLPGQVEVSRQLITAGTLKDQTAFKAMTAATPANVPVPPFIVLRGTGVYSSNSLECLKAALGFGSLKVRDASEQGKSFWIHPAHPHPDRNFAGLSDPNVALAAESHAPKTVKISFR